MVAWPVINNSRDSLLTGDQPAYLYITESLSEDLDIDIANNTLSEKTFGDSSGRHKHAGGLSVHNPKLIQPAVRIRILRKNSVRHSTQHTAADFRYLSLLST